MIKNHEFQNSSQWFFFNENQFNGPRTDSEIILMLQQGEINNTDKLWSKDQKIWKTISEIEKFNKIFQDLATSQSLQKSQKFNNQTELNKKDLWDNSDQFWSYIETRHQALNNKQQSHQKEIQKQKLNRKTKSIFAGFFVSTLIGLITFNKMSQISDHKNLSYVENQKAHSVISSSMLLTGSRFELFQKSKMHFIVATNLSTDSKIKIEFNGISDSLVGSFYKKQDFFSVVKDGFFEIKLQDSSSYIQFPEGDYQIHISCQNCETDKILFTEKIFLGYLKDEQYDLRLAQYHVQLREDAKSEIQEFSQIADALISQVQDLSFIANNLIENKESKNKFKENQNTLLKLKNWNLLQDQISSEILRIFDLNKNNKIFYSELSISLSEIQKSIGEISKNINQQNNINFESVQKNLQQVKTRIDYFIHRPLTSSGMPRNN